MSKLGTYNEQLGYGLLGEVFDAVVRFDNYLDDIDDIVPNVDSGEAGFHLGLYRGAIQKILLTNLEEPARLLGHASTGGSPLKPSVFAAVLNEIHTTFVRFEIVHHFLKFLPHPEPRREIHTLLREIQEGIPDSTAPKAQASVIMFEMFNYGEIDLHAALEKELFRLNVGASVPGSEAIVIILPFAQASNPLMWPIASHEIGHFIEEINELGKHVMAEVQGCDLSDVADSRELDWVQEYISDLVAARVLGPAYLFSIVSFMVVHGLLGELQKSHPSPLSRFRVVANELELHCLKESMTCFNGMVDECKSFFEGKFTFNKVNLGDVEEGPSSIAGSSIDDVIAIINKGLDGLGVKRMSSADLENAEQLSEELDNGHPIAALRLDGDSCDARLKKFEDISASDDLLGEQKKAEFVAARDYVIQEPSKTVEIINAGYAHRYRCVMPEMKQALKGKSPIQFYSEYKERAKRLDKLLIKSISTTEIHKLFS